MSTPAVATSAASPTAVTTAPDTVITPGDLPTKGDMGTSWAAQGPRISLKALVPLDSSITCMRALRLDKAATGFQQEYDQGPDSGLVATVHVEVAASAAAATADYTLLSSWMDNCTGGFAAGVSLNIPKVASIADFDGGAVYYHPSGGLPEITAIGRSGRGLIILDFRTQGHFIQDNVVEAITALRRGLTRLAAAHL